LDPTKLAKYPLEKIKTPEEIVEKVNALDLPLLIDRNAEDLLYRKE